MQRNALRILLFSFLWIPGLVLATSAMASQKERRPNVVIILVDDLGWADLGCYGADLHQSPHIDRFAKDSVRFTNAYAAAPVCTPTRAALMTGKSPARLHMTIWHEASGNPPQNRLLIPPITQGNLPHREVTLAEVLRGVGYHTAHVGKWHLGNAAHYPETQGFDINLGGTFWGAPATFFFPYRGSFGREEELRYIPQLAGGDADEYLTDRLTDEALRIMENSRDRPFFLHMAYHTVHTPIEAKQPLVERYQKRLGSARHHTNPIYAAMVHSLDENVGRILSSLDKLGIADNTIVILTSDNGGYINVHRGQKVTNNAPLRSGKGSLYEGGIRVPLMVRWPGKTTGGEVCHQPVTSMDLYPTILEMLDIEGDQEHNAQVEGLSLAKLLQNPQQNLSREALYWHYPHYYPTTTPVSAIRQGPWKLLEFHEDRHFELYHLGDDLGEREDLSKKMPDRAIALGEKLHQWQRKVGAQMAKKNSRR